MASKLPLGWVLASACILSFTRAEVTGNLRICVLRISFKEDAKASTTGNGQFLTLNEGMDCEFYQIDPPPHNQSYFESQLKAVDSYFRSVSYGNFGLDLNYSQIYPFDNSVYNLQNEMAYYHPYNQDDLHESRLVALFQHSLEAAYVQDSINFSNFDLIVVFHAGIGQDFTLPFLDPTPEDIPSTFVDQKMILESTGYNGIAVGPAFVTHGIILPETQNHLQYDIAIDMFSSVTEPCDYQYGLTGTFSLMIGFAVGLPPLWDIESGDSRVGIFGLMDQGSNNGRGLIPAPPDAWTRTFAGWETPMTVIPGNQVNLPARSEDNLVKIIINRDEYFLIENRTNYVQDGVSLDSMRYLLWEQSDVYPPFIKVLFDSIDVERDTNGVITGIPGYDLGMPAAGFLIWHIDENRIQAGLNDYSVNRDLNMLGIDLEEADGAQDLGYPSFFMFTDPSAGYFGDMWFNGNKEYERANPEMGGLPPTFSPYTFPNTNANNGSSTFLSIGNISDPGDTMSFIVSNSMIMAGFPDTTAFIRSVFDLDGDGVNEIIGGHDSLWMAQSNNLTDRLYFHELETNNALIGYVRRDDYTLVEISEYGSDFTKRWSYEYYFESETISLSSYQILDSLNYTVHFESTENPNVLSHNEWTNHTKKVLGTYFNYEIETNKNGISATDFEITTIKWANIEFDYIAGIDLDLDAYLDVLALDSEGFLYGFNSDLALMAGFPLDIQLQNPVLSRNLVSDAYPEIIAKSADSTSLYIFDHQGRVQFQIATFKDDDLVAVKILNGKKSILTRSTIYQFGTVTEIDIPPLAGSSGNVWAFEHGNWGRSRTVSLDYTVDFSDNELITRAYCYPNPVKNEIGTLRIETVNAENIDVQLYDLAGFYIDSFNRDIEHNPGNQISEWTWEVADIETGIYFAHVMVTKGSLAATDIIKIAVIH